MSSSERAELSSSRHLLAVRCLRADRKALPLLGTGGCACESRQYHCTPIWPEAAKHAASGPIPKFASARVTFGCELRNLRTTSNFMILVRF
jgi:hypothetical protein